MKYGIYLNNQLMESFDTPSEAYNEAKFAYNETGEFHEVKAVTPECPN